MKRSLAFAAALALAACATAPAPPPGTAAPSGPPTIPSSPFDLGDWRRGAPDRVLADFQSAVAGRYGAGLELAAVVTDLRRASFVCAANRDTRGDPPDQICRRTVTETGCTHTWQVYLYDDNGTATLQRTRGLYDRRCGGDGLLGGPT